MQTVLDNGLVLVRVLKQFGRNFPGQTAGFEPSLAQTLVGKGLAEHIGDAPAPASAPAPAAPEIPSDWKEMHHTRLITLAREIAGADAPADLNKQGAVAIIETELARRAAA